MRSLEIRLDAASRARVQALAAHPVLRGDHVTLARAVADDDFDPAWIPGGAAVGDAIGLVAVGEVRDGRIQALIVEVAGSSRRPFDGGVLHVTVSRAEGARSRDANELLTQATPAKLALPLGGSVAWVDVKA